MRSMIFSLVTGIALTLLLRAPAPAPPPPASPSAPGVLAAAAQPSPAEATAARVVEALRDSFPAWLAGHDVPRIAVAVVVTAGTHRCDEYAPGLFFTYRGEALELRGDQPTLRNTKSTRRPQ